MVAETEEKFTAMEKENVEGTVLEEKENLMEEMEDGVGTGTERQHQ